MIELSEFGYAEGQDAVREFENEHGAYFAWDDKKKLGSRAISKLAKLNDAGDTEEQIAAAGNNYQYSRVDYFKRDDPYRILAARVIAQIPSRERTELAFSPALSEQKIDIHCGEGVLMLGRPDSDKVKTFMLDAEITPSVTLPTRSFYTLRAASWSADPLVVSSLCFDDSPEINVEHDPTKTQDIIETDDGPLKVPMEFGVLYELRNC